MQTRSVRIPKARVVESYPAALALLRSAEADQAAASATTPGVARFVSPVSGGTATSKRVRLNFETVLREKADDAILPRSGMPSCSRQGAPWRSE